MKVCDEENFFKWLFPLAFLDIGTLLWGKIFFFQKNSMIMGLACSLYMATSMIDVEEGFVSGCGLDSLVLN